MFKIHSLSTWVILYLLQQYNLYLNNVYFIQYHKILIIFDLLAWLQNSS